MTTTIKVYRYTGNEDYADVVGLLDASSNEFPTGSIAFATAVAGSGLPDTISHVTPTSGLPVQQQTGATFAVSAASLPLPSGAATAINQATANTALAAIQTAVEALDNAISGSEMQVDVAGPLPAGANNIGAVDVLSVVPGAGATNLGKAEDAPHSTGDIGVAVWAVRRDTPSSGVDTDGDYAALSVDSSGRLYVSVGNTVTVTGTLTVTQSTAANLNMTEANSAAIAASLGVIDDWDESDRAKVNLIAGQAGITADAGAVAANTPRVTLASNDPAVVALTTLDDVVKISGGLTVGDLHIFAIGGYESLTARAWAMDSAGNGQIAIATALPAGANAIGKLAANSGVDIGDVDVTSISAGSNLIGDVGLQPRTSGGLSIFRSLDLDESEEEVKATAGQVYGIIALNLATSVRFLKLYNATAANVTVGTTTPVLTIPIPTQAGTAHGAGFTLILPQGIAFATAITAAVTTGVADNDTGAPGANDVVLNLLYK